MTLNPFKAWADRRLQRELQMQALFKAASHAGELHKENERLKRNEFYMMLIIMILIMVLVRILKEIL
jgi:uncharacterized membrane protein YhaH (DUF805 family)